MKRIPRMGYTLEFKLEALRRVRGGEPVRRVAREIAHGMVPSASAAGADSSLGSR